MSIFLGKPSQNIRESIYRNTFYTNGYYHIAGHRIDITYPCKDILTAIDYQIATCEFDEGIVSQLNYINDEWQILFTDFESPPLNGGYTKKKPLFMYTQYTTGITSTNITWYEDVPQVKIGYGLWFDKMSYNVFKWNGTNWDGISYDEENDRFQLQYGTETYYSITGKNTPFMSLSKPAHGERFFLQWFPSEEYLKDIDLVTLKVSWISDGPEISQPVKFWYSLDNGATYQEGEWDKTYYFRKGYNVILKASSETVVYFTKWDDENTDNPRTVVMNEDRELKAIFHQNWS